MSKPWLRHDRARVPAEVDISRYNSVVALMEESFCKNAASNAYIGMGTPMSYGELDLHSRALAAWLQAQGLRLGDRVALMLPNGLAYPVATAAVLRAGFIVVNLNPLDTAHELEHSLRDSGAKAIVILENFAITLQAVIATTSVKTVVVSAMSDLHPFVKGLLINHMVRRVRRLVRPWSLPGHHRLMQAMADGARMALKPVTLAPNDEAVLQHTGDATGVSQGVVLHKTLMAKLLAGEAWMQQALQRKPIYGQLHIVCALPLDHAPAFITCGLLGMHTGACKLLVANPRDLKLTIKALKPYKLHVFLAADTLFNGLVNHPDFALLDCSELALSSGWGPPVPEAVAQKWLAATGCAIVQGDPDPMDSPTRAERD